MIDVKKVTTIEVTVGDNFEYVILSRENDSPYVTVQSGDDEDTQVSIPLADLEAAIKTLKDEPGQLRRPSQFRIGDKVRVVVEGEITDIDIIDQEHPLIVHLGGDKYVACAPDKLELIEEGDA